MPQNMLIRPPAVPSISRAAQNALAIQGARQRNILAQQQIEAAPSERAWQEERRGMERQRFEMEQDAAEYEKSVREFNKSLEPLKKLEAMDKALELSSKHSTLSNHDQVVGGLSAAFGVNSAMVSSAEIVEEANAAGLDPETYYQRVWKPKSLIAWKEKYNDMRSQQAAEIKHERALELAQVKASGKKSPLKKMMDERQALVDSGVPESDKRVEAYDSKISGTEINLDALTPAEIDVWGKYLATTGKMPSLGRGKQATKIRQAIAKSAARQALGADADGVPDTPDKTPAEAAMEIVAASADTKAIQGSLNFLEKQIGAMGSFVTNLEAQVERVGELSEDLKTFDTRLLNVPLRAVRGRLTGSPLQAKYDMFLTEIESEIGKLATGSSASIAELSTTAQEKWDKIHDKNLSVKDMLSLLDETKKAARLRLESVQGQLEKTRGKMKTRDFGRRATDGREITTQAEYDALPSGAIYLEGGVKYRKP